MRKKERQGSFLETTVVSIRDILHAAAGFFFGHPHNLIALFFLLSRQLLISFARNNHRGWYIVGCACVLCGGKRRRRGVPWVDCESLLLFAADELAGLIFLLLLLLPLFPILSSSSSSSSPAVRLFFQSYQFYWAITLSLSFCPSISF